MTPEPHNPIVSPIDADSFNHVRSALFDLQKEISDFHAWSIQAQTSDSLQALLLGMDRKGLASYDEREVQEQTVSVTVYIRQDKTATMGQATQTIDSFRPFKDQILAAIEAARRVSNPVWELPSPPTSPYPDVQTADPAILEHREKVFQSLLANASQLAMRNPQVRVNSAELYLNRQRQRLVTSRGITLENESTSVYFEVAMEREPRPNQQEVHRYQDVVRAGDLDLCAFFTRCAEETCCLENTELPPTSDRIAVLVDAEVISKLLHALKTRLSAEAEYEKSLHFLSGQMIHTGDIMPGADPLTITLDPLLPLMGGSTAYTAEGLPAERAVIIANNRVQHQIISSRMGQYLNKQPNGITGNLCLKPGTRSKAELIDTAPECLEILNFSSLLVNPNTLTWSSEIKLGRLHAQGAAPRLIKGGIVSGDLRANCAGALFSRDTIRFNTIANGWASSSGYWGPDAALFISGIRIAGQ